MSEVEALALRRREVSGSGPGLTFEDVVEACLAAGLLGSREARWARERQRPLRPATGRRTPPPSPSDPAEALACLGLVPPGRTAALDLEEILGAVAFHLGVPRAQIDPLRLDPDAIVRALPRAFAVKHAVLVLDPHAPLIPLAAADPLDVEALETVRQRLGRPVTVSLAGRAEVLRLIQEIYGFKGSVAAAERDLGELPDLQNLEQFFRMRAEGEVDSADSHIVRAVDHLLRYGLDQRASDIHIEPKRERALVRLRIDGVLHTVHTLSRRVHPAIVSRLKTLARMDISEKRLPQDGRLRTEYAGRGVELRVSTLPVAFGEKVVLRIFDPSVLEQDLPNLGLRGADLAVAEAVLERPHGLVLVTGPTGSGKTTTLYAALRRLATAERNVSTVEDPIENVCEAFNQVGVHPAIGLTFASALRTLLRQDPDVLMVGEIRDSETAKMAIQAALTGHLVLSTLHTNDAPGGVGRLLDMGAEPYLLSSTLLAIVAQRLVRSPCPHCAAETPCDPHEARALGLEPGTPITAGAGCPRCRHTGYRGRVGLFEILEVDPEVAGAIHRGTPPAELRTLARSRGMRTLREAGTAAVREGLTTPREVLAETPPDPRQEACIRQSQEGPGLPDPLSRTRSATIS
ncbi:MAG: GspE/PulE family protein [Deferrisomatales bacterium]